MFIQLDSFIPLATILGAAAAPTVAAIWAEKRRTRDARYAEKSVFEVKETLMETALHADSKLDTIHSLVNNQLSQAVDRLNAATLEIDNLKILIRDLRGR